MGQKETIIREIENMSPRLLNKLADYIERLKADKEKEISDLMLASEKSLAKDWLLPEEDKAWEDL